MALFPISNPALGSEIVLVGGYLFPISKGDMISPNSMVGGGSFYTSNGSWLWGAGTKLYLKEDRSRITGAYGRAQLHYDLYGIGNSAGNLDVSVPIDQGHSVITGSLDTFEEQTVSWPTLPVAQSRCHIEGGTCPLFRNQP